ncbi:iron complex outermembrane recepter protein [Hymenobacter daecheongensis DSM 21074]|uniref:Iron complex outermembrane recepter protein n=1 Tax=Hymenobacter daecheongensis DSM 21074 TaxID=1121955 RepID=A0A1M6D0F4_9BACT|nr:TonB-dependent receptor [Hymenobacter daecheongensis]SHI66689.1 iron complex outermembrane recepter protein [Hymenobacter daecheongensis DSM 21074]
MKNLLVLGAALLALPCTSAWAQGPVSGTLTDAQTGTALPGATVLLDGLASAATDAAGTFSIPAVAAGAHELRITFVGYEPLVQRLQGQPTQQQLQARLQPGGVLTGEALVTASRANERTATAYTNLGKEDLQKRNFGQDLPYLLDQTPSVVVTSDAGAGVGYTDLRIRGTGTTGINMTINGVPLNDAESHGAFLVNLSDLASSVSSLQVQRGVGTSQNGGAAFGASVNISTLNNRREAYGETQNSVGSFGTVKNTVQFGSGLVGQHFTFDGRLSRIKSDGYMNRAASDLKSYYFAAGYQQKNTLLKFITFSGREKTYQAWNGVPEPALTGNRQLLQNFVDNGELTESDAARAVQEGRRYSAYTYDNQTDNYQQNHYQLHLSQGLGDDWNLGAALHLTRGFGYYESFRARRKFVNYGLANVVLGGDTLTRTDLIDRKWLDNYFYGGTFALNYQPKADDRLQATLGGAWNRYDGDHYGEIIWAQYASNGSIRQRYYASNALKTDYNGYARATWQVLPQLSLYGDLQLRHIKYTIKGNQHKPDAANAVKGVVDVSTRARYTFFNPKAGATLTLAEGQQLYASFAVGQREPVRSDFTDRPATEPAARAERLNDFEGGYRLTLPQTRLLGVPTAVRFEANGFYMRYRNQLVATGQLNDVGTPLRTNVARSYRRGVELTGLISADDKISLSSTLTLSQNRILGYQDVTYDAEYKPMVGEARTSTISYSPGAVSAHTLEGQPLKGLRLALLYKTVSRQYLDNSENSRRSLQAYQVLDARVRYTIRPTFVKEIELGLLVSNILNREYAANGYTYNYLGASGGLDTFNWYYPQATRNFLASVGVKF